MSNFAVCHVTKYSGSNNALGRHIDRDCEPENVENNLTKNNFDLVKPGGTLNQDINSRIEQAYTGKRAIRSDAVKSVGVILSGSHEQMKKIESEGELKKWAFESFQHIAERFGAENIVRATVHMDEKTPHMHLHFVPLTSDGRLSAKELINRKSLKELQVSYGERMEQFGLTRGIEGSKRKHVTTQQYYRYVNQNELDADKILKSKNAREIVGTVLRAAQEQKQSKEQNLENQPKSNKQNYYERRVSEANKKRRESESDRSPKLGR